MENDLFSCNVTFCCYFPCFLLEMLTAKEKDGIPRSNDVGSDDHMNVSCRSISKGTHFSPTNLAL